MFGNSREFQKTSHSFQAAQTFIEKSGQSSYYRHETDKQVTQEQWPCAIQRDCRGPGRDPALRSSWVKPHASSVESILSPSALLTWICSVPAFLFSMKLWETRPSSAQSGGGCPQCSLVLIHFICTVLQGRNYDHVHTHKDTEAQKVKQPVQDDTVS